MSSVSASAAAIPQAATSLLEACVAAIQKADPLRPIDAWLKTQETLSDSARRQVVSLLWFLDLLDDARRLRAEASSWRRDNEALGQALRERARRAYAAAGCDPRQAELLGNPSLSREALGRIWEKEPPFQRLGNPDTRRNAVRFACHLHEALVLGQWLPQPADPAPASETLPLPTLRDQGAIVYPQRYRVARLEGDRWVYGAVQFECPQGATDWAWLSRLDNAEQARWLEQLAAALLQEADSLRTSAGQAASPDSRRATLQAPSTITPR